MYTNNDFPFLLALSNILHETETDITVINNKNGLDVKRTPIIHINQNDALKYLINDGDLIEIETEKLRIKGMASLDYPHEGLISTGLLFGSMVNDIQNDPAERSIVNNKSESLISAKLLKL